LSHRSGGQAAVEFAVCAAVLAAALFAPVIEGTSVAVYLARQLVDWFHGLYSWLALT
jgi:hypothetical protein